MNKKLLFSLLLAGTAFTGHADEARLLRFPHNSLWESLRHIGAYPNKNCNSSFIFRGGDSDSD